MKTVAVFFGGKSVEHDISVITGVLTCNAINSEKYEVVPIYVSGKGEWFTGQTLLDLDEYKNLQENKLVRALLMGGDNTLYVLKGKKIKAVSKIAVAINCIHGERGEDGSLSGMLNMCGIPLASPNVLSASISMDKSFTKIALKGLGVKTLPYQVVEKIDDVEKLKGNLTYPVIVKPNCLGSSIGIKRAENQDDLVGAVSYALRFGKRAIIEPLLDSFIEINCAAYLLPDGTVKVSECERPIGSGGPLSFTDKYVRGGRVFPADISKRKSDIIKKITKKVYLGLGFTGVIRIDYFISHDEIYLNEINSVPGSLAYYLFGQTIKSFSTMLEELIAVAEREFSSSQTFQTEYKSGVLLGGGGKGAKRKRS